MPVWRLLKAEYTEDPGFNHALDRSIAEDVGRAKSPPTVRLWRPGRCLAVGRFDRKLPRFEEAVQAFTSARVPVVQRLSGGQAVWQDAGHLNFSVIAPRERIGVPEAYRRFCEGLILGLRELGIESEHRHVEGAFCDGPYDLAIGNRKMVGTAQAQKRDYMIVHGTILVDCDIDEMIRMISQFYERSGEPKAFRRESMITLREALGRPFRQQELMDALATGYQRSLHDQLSVKEAPMTGEGERASELAAEITLS